MEKKKQQQSYENYVRQKTPVHNLPVNMAKAFVTGGAICVIGQGILNICEKAGLGRDMSGSWCSMLLVLLSAVLTGCNLYPQIAKWGGAGALVPITGFANSVAAPAIERRTGYRNRVQDIYHCRTGDPVWDIYKLAAWTVLLAAKSGRSCRIICMEI